jgi:hypothetical protein
MEKLGLVTCELNKLLRSFVTALWRKTGERKHVSIPDEFLL